MAAGHRISGIAAHVAEEHSPAVRLGSSSATVCPSGPAFFVRYGWNPIEVHSVLKTAAGLKRLTFAMRLLALLPENPNNSGSRPWSGVFLLASQLRRHRMGMPTPPHVQHHLSELRPGSLVNRSHYLDGVSRYSQNFGACQLISWPRSALPAIIPVSRNRNRLREVSCSMASEVGSVGADLLEADLN